MTHILFLLLSYLTATAQTDKPRTPGDEQYRRDIIQYTEEECALFSDAALEKSRKVWMKKLNQNKCKRKLGLKPAEIKELCDEINVHIDIIQSEQNKRKKK